MKILLVEDDPSKESTLSDAVFETHAGADIIVARSVQKAISAIRENEFDFIILDISLPGHQMKVGGAQPLQQPSGGVEVLLELGYSKRSDRVIIVTQYPDIEYGGALYPLAKFPKRIMKDIDVTLVTVIKFSPQSLGWRTQFKKGLG